MKRWIRRILLACSIGLLVGWGALWCRAQFVGDVIAVNDFQFYAHRQQLRVLKSNDGRIYPLQISSTSPLEHEPEDLLPEIAIWGKAKYFAIPHWMIVAAGSVYPMLRHRRAFMKSVRVRYTVYALTALVGVLGLIAQLSAAGPDTIPCVGFVLLVVLAFGSLFEFAGKQKGGHPE